MIEITDEKSFKKAFESCEECRCGDFTFHAALLRNLAFKDYEECAAWFDMKDRELRKVEHIRQIKAAADSYAYIS